MNYKYYREHCEFMIVIVNKVNFKSHLKNTLWCLIVAWGGEGFE